MLHRITDSHQGIDQICYRNLSQHYVAEFSQLTGKVPDILGCYVITPIKERQPGYLWKREDGSPLGFAVVNEEGPTWDIVEFYVIPSARRLGIGRKLAFAVFDRYPGPWQVRQILEAQRAKAFWLRVISEFTDAKFSEGVEDDPIWGRVSVQRFYSTATGT